MKALITGSHAYGLPKPESDVDLVLLVEDEATRTVLVDASDPVEDDGLVALQYNGVRKVLRFGKLNLLLATEKEFEVWQTGTDALVGIARPVERYEAIELFRRLRMLAGV